MGLNFDTFVRWADNNFDSVKIHGSEVQLNSIFREDDKDNKLWCNPSKGRFGTYHCWKSEESGNLIQLVMKVNGCSREEALEILDGEMSLQELSKKVEEFWENQANKVERPTLVPNLDLPPYTYALNSLPKGNPSRQQAESFLNERLIPIDGLYVCVSGRYKDRIVIPYYDNEGNLIYYNCRTLTNQTPKYLGPPKEIGIGKGDVIFIKRWFPPPQVMFVTEGELDAIIIDKMGFCSAALGGKEASSYQSSILQKYTVVLASDGDEAGIRSLIKIGDSLWENLTKNFEPFYILPPEDVKDWNEFLLKYGDEVAEEYMMKGIKPYKRSTREELRGRYFIG